MSDAPPKSSSSGRPPRAFGEALSELAKSVVSPDKPTRRAGWIFFLTLALALFLLFVTIRRWVAPKYADVPSSGHTESDTSGQMSEFLERQHQEEKWKSTTLGLGDFVIDLKRKGDEVKAPGVNNVASLELFIECDTRETCEYIEGSSVQTRSQVTNALIQIDREELLSKDGKRKIKKAIIDRLNTWLPKGRIENLYITKLVIS